MLQRDRLTDLHCQALAVTSAQILAIKGPWLFKRHSPMYNPDQEQFPRGEESLKSHEKAQLKQHSTRLYGTHATPRFCRPAGRSSLSGATLEEERGCSSERPSNPNARHGNAC